MKEVFRWRRFQGKAISHSSVRSPTIRTRTHFRSKVYVPVLLALAMLAMVVAPAIFSPSGAQSKRQRLEQDIEQVFTNHEEVRLDTPTVAEKVKEIGRLSLQTSVHDFEMSLTLNDLRAPNYRAEEVGHGGLVRDVQMPAPTTYKGIVDGVPRSEARFTINDEKLEGMILIADQSYYLESARKYSAAADPADYLLYKASDVRPDVKRTCGVTLDEEINAEAKQFASSLSSASISPEVFSPFKVAEIATEADFEYVSAFGGSSANTNNDILSIMNGIQGIYERDIGLTFTVTFQHTWASADPYSTSGSGQPAANLLNSFTNYWNANFTSTQRDLAHLWTGKNLGGPAGVAWQGVVCFDAQHSYGLSDLENMTPFRVGIPAHEIGHNFNASHCDGQAGCDNTIMVATQTPSNNLTFCPFSVNEITTWVNGHSTCLSQASAPPVIQFSASSYPVNEGGARVNITVNRSGDTSGTSSVNYQTIDGAGLQDCALKNGIASPRCDYEFTVGTLQFAAGENSKSFSVAIIDDTYAEGPETFNVSLSNPIGATLGAQLTATVTIIDNDTIDGPNNPIDNTTFFVRQHYLDFLGREPDPAGPVWISIINGCAPNDTSCDRVHVSQNFFQSEEFQTRGYFIYRFYPVSFPNVSGSDPAGYGHKPDYMQFVPDLARVSGFLDANQLEAAKVAFIADFMARPAWVARYGSLNNTLYVDTLLSTANVTVAANTRQGWIDGLNTSTLTRAQVLRQIAESPEVYNKYYNAAFVIMQYFGYLRRDPDGAYLVWIQVLNSTNDSRGMITGFVNSAEYRHRFGP